MNTLLIPYFAFESDAADAVNAACAKLALPNIEQYLKRSQCTESFAAEAYSYSTPHEIAHAKLLGICAQDGQIPWAAYETQSKVASAWITPCHWNVGVDSIQMGMLRDLTLSPEHAEQLIRAMQPYFAQDGIDLSLSSSEKWLAKAKIFEDLSTASLDRVVGRNISPWLRTDAASAPIRRLQNEMQMLLYTHPVNDERIAQGLAPINSFWVHGAGRLDQGVTALRLTSQLISVRAEPVEALKALRQAQGERLENFQLLIDDPACIQIEDRLKRSALEQNLSGWCEALQSLDREVFKPLLESKATLNNTQVIFCGERGYQVWRAEKPSFKAYFLKLLNKKIHTECAGAAIVFEVIDSLYTACSI